MSYDQKPGVVIYCQAGDVTMTFHESGLSFARSTLRHCDVGQFLGRYLVRRLHRVYRHQVPVMQLGRGEYSGYGVQGLFQRQEPLPARHTSLRPHLRVRLPRQLLGRPTGWNCQSALAALETSGFRGRMGVVRLPSATTTGLQLTDHDQQKADKVDAPRSGQSKGCDQNSETVAEVERAGEASTAEAAWINRARPRGVDRIGPLQAR